MDPHHQPPHYEPPQRQCDNSYPATSATGNYITVVDPSPALLHSAPYSTAATVGPFQPYSTAPVSSQPHSSALSHCTAPADLYRSAAPVNPACQPPSPSRHHAPSDGHHHHRQQQQSCDINFSQHLPHSPSSSSPHRRSPRIGRPRSTSTSPRLLRHPAHPASPHSRPRSTSPHPRSPRPHTPPTNPLLATRDHRLEARRLQQLSDRQLQAELSNNISRLSLIDQRLHNRQQQLLQPTTTTTPPTSSQTPGVQPSLQQPLQQPLQQSSQHPSPMQPKVWTIYQHSTTFYNILHHFIKFYNILQHSTTFYNILQYSTTFYNILQHSTTF